jgi:hypothetical protein
MDVTPVGAIGSGRSSRRAEVAGDNDYDRQVRIARRFRDAEPDRRRQQRPAPPTPAADQLDEVDESASDEPHAGAELDTYL